MGVTAGDRATVPPNVPPVSSLSASQHNGVLEEPEPGQLCHALRFGLVRGDKLEGSW